MAVNANNSPGHSQRLAIFDLCDTLYDANTTLGFIDHYQSAGRNPRIARAIDRWSSRASPWFYLGAISHRVFGRDLARRRILAALAGEPRTRLAQAAANYARTVLPSRANVELHGRLNSHVAAGDEVMLVSSSIDLVVSEIAETLGVGYRASALGFEHDRCTGELQQDLAGRKAEAIEDLLERAASISVYTDNPSDGDLVARADQAYIVVPRGKPLVRWGGPNCEYITL